VAEIPGAEIAIEKERMGPPVGAPVAVEVSGDEFCRSGELAARVRRELAAIPGVTDLRDNYRVGRPEMRLSIDRGAAKRVGLSTQAVAGAVRTAVAGTGAITHIDQELVVTIEGDIAEGFNENDVRERVNAYLAQAEMPPGYRLRLGGADDEQRKTERFLSRAFLVSIFLIGLVLVSQFNRYDLPFIILSSVVLSMVGVLWGLIITGTPFGILMTGVGVISLAGVVVNNAIVLLDYVEKLRAQGMSLNEALIDAGVTRFRPVMLTAITTILGLVPMAIGISIDFAELRVLFGGQSAEWWGPMAVAVIFGLAFATLLTLVMVPLMYSLLEDFRHARQRAWARVSRKPQAAGS
jgi:multidrug efflux pump